MASSKDRILAFVGSDEAQVKEAALAAVRQRSPQDDGGMGTDIVDGGSENSEDAARIVREVIMALQTLPFFGGTKLVWLKNANFLGDSVTGRAAATQDAVKELEALLAKGLPDEVCFVISATAIDKRRAFYKFLQKSATLEVFDKVDISREGWESKLVPLIVKRGRRLGLDFAPGAAEHFVMTVGEDTRQLESELVKLRAYLGNDERPVTSDDLREIISKTRGGIVFEIGNAIGRRDLPKALQLLEHFLRLGESAVGIIRAAIIPKIRNLLAARDLMDRHRNLPWNNYNAFQAALERLPESETATLPRTKQGKLSVYPLFLAAGEAKKYSLSELANALRGCLDADYQLVFSSTPPKLVLSQFLIKTLARTDKKAG
ncbi:DNA polymerase III subunit delta [Sulfuriroseicoccus oceanibius]|uniref:DNA polymerase III subunit delta n=1 Tax=Sulfuriroseicoccus oceanibius TaxID=2707525 RepID=A0A6B3L941_9BACT|nr:DNA polymerase III subunit delta [Sulfuriroseicoccus oceanibius]QQL45539.1 DNA polymerase III subunit delta [Sulfuriroseicoccus oceanibius]